MDEKEIRENDAKRIREITDDINRRMSEYTGSLQPTDDEVTIAWLLTEVGRLTEERDGLKSDNYKLKLDVSMLNHDISILEDWLPDD